MNDPKKLTAYAKEQGAVAIKKVVGPNGAFISLEMPEGKKVTLPVGKRSQAGTIQEYNILVTPEGQAIATVNHYSEAEAFVL